jgi:hypothetical protein
MVIRQNFGNHSPDDRMAGVRTAMNSFHGKTECPAIAWCLPALEVVEAMRIGVADLLIPSQSTGKASPVRRRTFPIRPGRPHGMVSSARSGTLARRPAGTAA